MVKCHANIVQTLRALTLKPHNLSTCFHHYTFHVPTNNTDHHFGAPLSKTQHGVEALKPCHITLVPLLKPHNEKSYKQQFQALETYKGKVILNTLLWSTENIYVPYIGLAQNTKLSFLLLNPKNHFSCRVYIYRYTIQVYVDHIL